MRRLTLLLAALGLMGAAPMTLQPRRPVEEPRCEKPRVVLSCVVGQGGAYDNCKVLEEAPADEGWGSASLKWAAQQHIDPIGPDGKTRVGQLIKLPVNWSSGGAPIVGLAPGRHAPDPEDIFPTRAQEKHRAGLAVIACSARHDGRLIDCRAVSESPAGYAFAFAAIRLATDYQACDPPPSGDVHILKLRVKFDFDGLAPAVSALKAAE